MLYPHLRQIHLAEKEIIQCIHQHLIEVLGIAVYRLLLRYRHQHIQYLGVDSH